MEPARSVHVRTLPDATDYEVRVEAGGVDRLPQLTRERAAAHRYAVISDDVVAGLYGAGIAGRFRSEGLDARLLTFAAGEERKTRAEWARLTDAMLAAGFGRDACVVAVGGGVTGDLAGFVAATYMRGIPVVQVPTTLLAMVDASVGGKTGVDAPAGKNLVGAFHQPRLVLADPLLLQTLATREVRNGLAEVVKHGAIGDPGSFELLEERIEEVVGWEWDLVGEVVGRSVALKADIVARDEREGGVRRVLNFGHTVGHALEAATGYGMAHGEAVSVGMVAEARVGEALGVTEGGTAERIRALLRRVGLPTALPEGVDPRQVVDRQGTDKKRRSGRTEYVLLERVGRTSRDGEGRWSRPVPEEAVLDVLAGMEAPSAFPEGKGGEEGDEGA